MSYLASEFIGWGLMGLFSLMYLGTGIYGVHDMFYGKVDHSIDSSSSKCPFSNTEEYKDFIRDQK